MDYFIIALVCFLGGAFASYLALGVKRRGLDNLQKQLESQGKTNQLTLTEIDNKRRSLSVDIDSYNLRHAEFDARVIAYDELSNENGLLKQDLRNIGVTLRKLQLDRGMQADAQETINTTIEALGRQYLKENVKWIGDKLNANNFSLSKQRLENVIARCREIGLNISPEEEGAFHADLRVAYEKEVRAAFEREEQARIKAQIREEQKLQREIQREQLRVERERAAVEAALAQALAAQADEHSAEVESLRARLAAVEEKERAISQAQLTKAGFVYVISNIGSFGENVYKIGMTRRLEPQDRVRELGDASVPFPFDVHMMISCDNAPALENALHRQFYKLQVNKTNPRKEFFRVDLDSIVAIVREQHGEIEYTADAEALQFRQSLAMPEDDQEFIEHVFDELEEEDESFDDDLSRPITSSE